MKAYPKISQTLLEFGQPMIRQLPPDYTKSEFEQVMRIVVTIWNAVTIDAWFGTQENQESAKSAFAVAPLSVQRELQDLIARKKKVFGKDLRAVGEYWVRETDNGVIFGCEARINQPNTSKSQGKH